MGGWVDMLRDLGGKRLEEGRRRYSEGRSQIYRREE